MLKLEDYLTINTLKRHGVLPKGHCGRIGGASTHVQPSPEARWNSVGPCPPSRNDMIRDNGPDDLPPRNVRRTKLGAGPAQRVVGRV
jgi:hypothetical protein